ncbi:unnamed protein product [Vitrella brassicaformis CCMP3155]|uniref:Uncharacterized protein n=1 Tax=Vitrella brassicaformis (strain CCMP3155) TaxID=1169540 RepID=A0A0G4EXE9_VITBC|nr:unnamed protein product [Vitrella brassicaformis CCMP3155]|eukprot:CEM02770.1 unnamed protein product [Vitrella brassicaformis CCMP3155]
MINIRMMAFDPGVTVLGSCAPRRRRSIVSAVGIYKDSRFTNLQSVARPPPNQPERGLGEFILQRKMASANRMLTVGLLGVLVIWVLTLPLTDGENLYAEDEKACIGADCAINQEFQLETAATTVAAVCYLYGGDSTKAWLSKDENNGGELVDVFCPDTEPKTGSKVCIFDAVMAYASSNDSTSKKMRPIITKTTVKRLVTAKELSVKNAWPAECLKM